MAQLRTSIYNNSQYDILIARNRNKKENPDSKSGFSKSNQIITAYLQFKIMLILPEEVLHALEL